jgi:hypothetical protein
MKCLIEHTMAFFCGRMKCEERKIIKEGECQTDKHIEGVFQAARCMVDK